MTRNKIIHDVFIRGKENFNTRNFRILESSHSSAPRCGVKERDREGNVICAAKVDLSKLFLERTLECSEIRDLRDRSV